MKGYKKCLGALLALTLLGGVVIARTSLNVSAYNDTTACNTDSYSSEAIEIEYQGKQTTVYGIQAYAGVSGPMWIVGDVADVLGDDSNSHTIGSNEGDGRGGFKMTFKVNSSVAGNAYLGVFAKIDAERNSNATLNVNGVESSMNFYNLNNVTWNQSVPTMIPVTLVEGSNVISITMQENYTIWVGSFFVSNVASYVDPAPYNSTSAHDCEVSDQDAVAVEFDGTQTIAYGIQSYAGISGPAWIVGGQAAVLGDGSKAHTIGSNQSDGRDGFEMTFKVNSTYAGDAYLDLFAELDSTGNSGATLTVNGVDTSINLFDLNGVAWNQSNPTKIPVTLVNGENIIKVKMQDDYTIWAGSFRISPTAIILTKNETNLCNCELPEQPAYAIDYEGEATKVYGVQAYCGLNANKCWAVGDVAPILEDGTTSHKLGSNTGDGRSNLELTFKVNSTVAGDAYLNLYAEFYGENGTNETLTVNGVSSSINLYQLNSKGSVSEPTLIPITLVEGENIIKITTQESYGTWFGSFAITASNDVKLPTYEQISVGAWSNKTGYMSADNWAIGLNAFDNSADYGKEGSVDYVFTTEEEGDYYLKINAMAGSAVAN